MKADGRSGRQVPAGPRDCRGLAVFRLAALSACSAHLSKLTPLRAAAFSAAACTVGATLNMSFPLAGFSGTLPSCSQAAM